MIAEKCEAVFGRPIMLQVNGIDHVYGRDVVIPITNVIGARAYNMGSPVRSKKMAVFKPSGRSRGNWTSQAKNGPHLRWLTALFRCTDASFWPDWALRPSVRRWRSSLSPRAARP
jgi:hypothetical protein